MDSRRIGVFSDSFKLGLYGGIAKAAEIGVGAVQIATVGDEISPEKFDNANRRELRRFLEASGLKIASTCGDLGGHGLSRAQDNLYKLPKYMQQVDLACDLGCDVITTHIGVIPEDETDPRYAVLLDAVGQLGQYAKHCGVRLAIETGPETPEILSGFVHKLTDNVGVNLDPANLVMVTGSDPVKAVYTLRDRIYHTHVKDGKMLKYAGPEVTYNFFAEGGIGDLRLEEYFLELPLGKGSVNIKTWLAALKDIDYQGFYTIEREVGENPERDIRFAVDFLRQS